MSDPIIDLCEELSQRVANAFDMPIEWVRGSSRYGEFRRLSNEEFEAIDQWLVDENDGF
jgi:late competence protein required for DNA uptake (superfamily II DNA/RNA helicase)